MSCDLHDLEANVGLETAVALTLCGAENVILILANGKATRNLVQARERPLLMQGAVEWA